MKITILNTGGTFNKRYNPLNGELEVASDDLALQDIIKYCYNAEFEIQNIISKDSLDMNDTDRKIIVEHIENSENQNIIIVHGTDTMDLTALYIDKNIKDKKIILFGSMLPFSIEKVEATLNFAQALGFLNANILNGVYISMHGSVKSYKNIYKDSNQRHI